MIIQEFPFSGIITRKVSIEEDNGDTTETTTEIYNGKLDSTMNTAEVGSVAQTSNYIVSMPLTKDTNGAYIKPHKDDVITVNEYGDVYKLVVNNSIVSQLGGITVYASRGEW